MNAADLFVANLHLIEVEVHSLCNRKCWFCPNSLIDRGPPVREMDEALYLRLLDDLLALGWTGLMSFGRYNEPFSHDVFYTRLQQARARLQHSTLHTNTNGDFLTPAALDRAIDAGLTSIEVQLYPVGKQWTPAIADARMQDLRNLLPCVEWTRWWDSSSLQRYKAEYRGIAMAAKARDFSADGVNRCGLGVSDRYIRSAPCMVAHNGTYIDYTGDVMPCCNLRSDYDKHAQHSFGRLTTYARSLARILASPKAVAWRLAGESGPPAVYPCLMCRFAVAAETETPEDAS